MDSDDSSDDSKQLAAQISEQKFAFIRMMKKMEENNTAAQDSKHQYR